MNKLVVSMKQLYQRIPTRWQEIIRFCFVGGLATVVHYGIYLLLQIWIWTWMAYSVGYLLSFVMNYVLTNYFTFNTKPSVQNGVGFIISHAVNYGLHIGLLELFLWMGVPEVWAPIPVYCIVIPVNFILVRFIFTRIDKIRKQDEVC